MFRGYFLADVHCSKARKDKCLKMLNLTWNITYQTGNSRDTRVPVFFSGDFYDSALSTTESSGYPQFIEKIHDLNMITHVYMITGTPLHDPSKSYKVFELMGVKVFEENTYIIEEFGDKKFELIAIPEPRKVNFVSKLKKGEDISQAINNDMYDFIHSIPPKKDLPRIVMYHGEITGETLPNRICCSSAIGISPNLLNSLNADAIMCGHIHKYSKVNSVDNCYYIGSSPAKNWDEEHESAITEVIVT